MKKRFASKALCMLLAFTMVMSLGVTASAAANTIVAERSAERITNGEQVTITISLKQAMVKFSGFNVALKYNKDAFEFISAQWESDEIENANVNTSKLISTPEDVALRPGVVAAGFVFINDNNFENFAANYDLVSFTFQAKENYGGKYTFEVEKDFDVGYFDGTDNVSLRGNLDFENTYVIIEGPRVEYILAVEDAYNTYNPDEYTKTNWSAITLIYTDALEAIYNSTIEADWIEARDNAIADMGIIPKGGDEEDGSGDNSGDNSGNGNNNNTPQGPGTYIPQAPSGPVGGVVGGGTGGIGGGTGGGGGGTGGGGAPVVPDDNEDKETTSGGIVIDDTLVPGAIAGPEVTDTQINAVEALYTDMTDHWARGYVYELSLVRGIFKGNGDGTFAPDIGITRQEISVALGRLLGYDERAAAVTETEYLDNETIADWARGYIAVMSEEKILLGDSDGNFYPEDIITREQLALILSRLVEKPQAVAAMKFNDVDKISEWAAEGCSISYTYGIIKGYPDNTFRGINEVTRSEAATMIYNYIQVTEDVENEELADEITDIAENAYN